MTNSEYTHLGVIVDRSGSMWNVQDDMIGGLNELFREQAELPGKCLVDYFQFDDSFEHTVKNTDVSEVKAVLEPRGMTGLLDAIGKSVTILGEHFRSLKESERPGTVIVIVVTDGMENASRDWTRDKVKALVEQQESQWNWKFVFLGANMDAIAEGATMGYSKGSTLTWNTNTDSVLAATAAASTYTTQTRSGVNYEFTDDDRNAANQ